MGDILLATPLLAELRELFPKARIDFLVYPEYASVLAGNPDLSELKVYSKSRPWTLPGLVRGYDWVIDLLADGASAWACLFSGARARIAFESRYPRVVHNVRVPKRGDYMYAPALKLHLLSEALRRLGGAPIGERKLLADSARLKLVPSAQRRGHWREILAREGRKGADPLVMMSPTSRRVTRRWRADGYAAVAKLLVERRGAQVLCLWGEGEREDAARVVERAANRAVNLAPRLADISDLAAYLSNADVLIGNCNGTKHVGVALGLPVVTVHMSSDPRTWNPPNPDGPGFHPRFPVVRVDLACIACQKNDCPYDLECSTELAPERVFAAAAALLGTRA